MDNGGHGAWSRVGGGMHQPGLTKREYMATHIMAGIAADSTRKGPSHEIANAAVSWADALLEALNTGDEQK